MASDDVARGAQVVVAKIGTSSITDGHGDIDEAAIAKYCAEVVELRALGHRVVVVTSGAIAAGLPALGLGGDRRPRDAVTLQALSAVGQSRLMRVYDRVFADLGIVSGQVLLAPLDFVVRQQYLHARGTLLRLLDLGVVPVVNENDAIADDEIRFGDNDRLAALVAHLVHAEALILLSDVDGLYTAHPGLPDSRRITDVHGEQDLTGVDVSRRGSAVGTGGMVTKIEAARIATGAGIPVVLTSAPQAAAALEGQAVGTRFHPTGRRRPTRLLWLAHASNTKGGVHLDAGAVRALTVRKASLLPAGVTGVTGTFAAGDPIDLIGPDDVVIARGIVNYDSAELPALLGRSTRDLAAELGVEYEREVVHRDDMMVI